MRFEFATAARIVFGPGAIKEIGGQAKALGSRALVVTGKTASRAEGLRAGLAAAGVSSTVFALAGEPTTTEAVEGVERARREKCDLVIGFGGGSAVDAAKAISALLANPGELLDYLEVVGRSQPLLRPAAPCIAVPTTAGAGAEVTRNAVLASPSHRVKASLRSPLMLPRLALVDSELTWSLPAAITASTGLDALTQLIEPYVSSRANPLVDALCAEGMGRVARSLRRACECGEDSTAREDMALASLFGGLALANAGLGAVHGFAAPLGGMFPAPHGAVCAALLAPVMEVNSRVLRRRAPDGTGMRRYQAVGRLLTGSGSAAIEDGVQWVRELCAELDIPPLRSYGVRTEDLAAVSEKAAVASSMKANPVELTSEERLEILQTAW